jgi:hypothetical protein
MTFATSKVPVAKNTAKAWVNFDGTGAGATRTIRDSYNVSSVADNAEGDYTINFATTMANANYCANLSVGKVTLSTTVNFNVCGGHAAPTTAAFRLQVNAIYADGSTADADPDYVYATFFGA